MQRLILAFVVGLFGGPSSPPTPPASPASPAPAAAAEAPAPFPRVALKAPLTAAEVRQARAQVRHTKAAGEDGKVVHRFLFPDGAQVEFSDRPKRPRDQANRSRVVMFTGTESASTEPDTTFDAAGKAAGLSPEAIEALRFISRHEGGFDAINTWDRARFSWGFIQFAGGYGFPPALLNFKERSPELFAKLLADYGVDLVRNDKDEPIPVYVDPESGKQLRGDAAEQAYGDDPLVIALFIRAGRVTEVKQRQVEAAIRGYALPALEETADNIRLSEILRSPQGQAMLIDRKVQEGNVIRLEWATEHVRAVRKLRSLSDCARYEGEVLDLAVQDADARTRIAELSEAAADGLGRAAAAARSGEAEYVADGPTLAGARDSLSLALTEASYRMVVSHRRDSMIAGFTDLVAAADPAQFRGQAPSVMASKLETVAGNIRALTGRFRFEYAIRNRLQNIRASSLPGPESRLTASR